ncbi:hypothetical protein GmHk_18G052489 [Glycine max]|nr:hypothetical protein GmHk_18G052489 [Glycine max]
MLHIAYGMERPLDPIVSHGRKVEKFGRPTPEIEGLVVATGLTPLIVCSVDAGDRGAISAFVERWHKETSSFHLLIRDLTITLDDVASLLHLPIIGVFHNFEPLHVDEAVIMLVELLEFSGEEARAETAQCHGGICTLVVATRYLSEEMREPTVDTCNSCSTGRQIADYIILLQCWIYEHFPNVHDSVTDDGYDETSPRAYQWLTMKAYMKGLTESPYRTRINALMITYGELRWGPIVVTLRSERVVRHFGYIQTIPPPPISATLSYEDIDDKWMHYSDHLAAAGQIFLMPRQCSGDYMEWFFRISHSFITPTQAADQPRHPLVPQHEAYVEPDISEVLVAARAGPSQAADPPRHAVDACEAIVERLECVLNLMMVIDVSCLCFQLNQCGVKLYRASECVVKSVNVVSRSNFNTHAFDYVLSILTTMYHTCVIDFSCTN